LHLHLINLDRSSDRLAEFKAVNAHLAQVSRFPAVDGSTLDIAALAARGLVAPDILTHYPLGAVGLAMSNLALWDMAIQTRTNVTIVEDDAIFNRQFDRCADEVIRTLPPDWDVIVWGWNFDLFLSFEMLPGVSLCLAQFEQDRMRANVGAFQQQPVAPRPYRLRWAFGTFCYTVSPKGAAALKGKCLPLRPMLIECPEAKRAPPLATTFRNVGLDNTLNSVYRALNAFICFPPLVIAKNETSRSTIQNNTHSARQAPPAADKAPVRVTEDADALINRGNALFDAGRFADAVAAFDAALTTRSNDFAALNLRGLALEHLQRLDEALASYAQACAARPDSSEALYNRANVLADLQCLDEALGAYDAALAARSDYLPALYNRALVLDRMGRLEEALAGYAGVLAIDPDHLGARDNHRALREELDRSATPRPEADSAARPAQPAPASAKTLHAVRPIQISSRQVSPTGAARQKRLPSSDRTKYFLRCSKCGERGEMVMSEAAQGALVLHTLSKGFKRMPGRSNDDELRIICSTCQLEVRF